MFGLVGVNFVINYTLIRFKKRYVSVIHESGLVNTWNKRNFLSSCDSFHDMRQ